MIRRDKMRFYYGVFLSVFTAFIGILFIAEAADLYYTGKAAIAVDPMGSIYSREAVGARLLEMLAPLILWILAVLVGVIVDAVFPAAPKKRGRADEISLYTRLRVRASEEKNPEIYAKIGRMEKARLAVRIAAAGFCLLSAVMCIVYLATASHFTSLEELNANILRMVANVFPWVGAALAVLIGETVFERLFAKKMLPDLKLLVGGTYTPPKWERATQIVAKIDNKYAIFGIRIGLLVFAVVLIGLGIWNGGARSVLIKAINICTECIGLG